MLARASVVYCNCISWPAALKYSVATQACTRGAVLLFTSPLPVAIDGVPCHLERQFQLLEAYCAHTFSPRLRLCVYIRKTSALDAALEASQLTQDASD